MESDKLSLSLKTYPDLAAEFAGVSPGDTVTLTLTFLVDEVATDIVTGSIDCDTVKSVSIVAGPGLPDEEEKSDPTVIDDTAQPVVSVMDQKYGGKRK